MPLVFLGIGFCTALFVAAIIAAFEITRYRSLTQAATESIQSTGGSLSRFLVFFVAIIRLFYGYVNVSLPVSLVNMEEMKNYY